MVYEKFISLSTFKHFKGARIKANQVHFMADQPKSTFENINDLIKALLWPVIIFIFFLSYRSEFNSIVKLIPKKLENSSKITIGSLSFEIEKTAKESGNGELAEIIKNLSERGIRKLLTLGSGRHSLMVRNETTANSNSEKSYSIPRDIDVVQELAKKGLLVTDEPLDNFISFFMNLKPIEKEQYTWTDESPIDSHGDPISQKYTELQIPISKLNKSDEERIDHYGFQLSSSGKKAFDIIVHVIAEQINKT